MKVIDIELIVLIKGASLLITNSEETLNEVYPLIKREVHSNINYLLVN